MSAQIEHLKKSAQVIAIVGSFHLISIGLIGNVLSFIIYKRKVFRTQSMGTYLSCLSIFNIFVLLTLSKNLYYSDETYKLRLIANYTNSTTENARNFIDNIIQTNVFCKFYAYIHYINIQYCSWVLVINSIDHLISLSISVNFHIKHKLRLKHVQYLILLITYIFLALLNIPLFINSYFDVQNNACDIEASASYLTDTIDLLFSTVIPFIIMTVCTVMIIIKMFKWHHTYKTVRVTTAIDTTPRPSPSPSRLAVPRTPTSASLKDADKIHLKRKHNFARTVLSINLLFLLCNLPICIIVGLYNYYRSPFVTKKLSQLSWAYIDLVYRLFQMLMYLHNAIPFFLYIISNRLFRKELFVLFCIVKKKIQFRNIIHNNYNNHDA